MKEKIEAIKAESPGCHGKDFLLTWEKSEPDLRLMLDAGSQCLKEMRSAEYLAKAV
ncbi:MAG: hypothetical protein MZV63_49310 [Marinilabiliales bacterium]|nr:hypothetical protein [Marinilabiliales bacterium]